MAEGIYEIQPSTMETIDRAMFDFVNEQLNIFSETNKGFKKVPIIWVGAERAYQIKNEKGLRDANGTLILPLISIERKNVVKDPARKGKYYANIKPVNDAKGGSIVVSRRIKQDKTANFTNASTWRRGGNVTEAQGGRQINFRVGAKTKRTVYETISIPQPIYLDITYSISLRSEYQQQMNQMVTPFITRTGAINHFVMKRDGHLYEGFIQQDFAQDNNISTLEEEERTFITSVDIKVLGYIMGSDVNEDRPKIVKRESAAEIRIGREKVILGDIPENKEKAIGFDKYRR